MFQREIEIERDKGIEGDGKEEDGEKEEGESTVDWEPGDQASGTCC